MIEMEETVRLHESLPVPAHPRTRIILDKNALSDNYRLLLSHVQRVSPLTRGCAVVKADAYGHGIRPAAEALTAAGCRSFAVSCTEEGIALRRILRTIPSPGGQTGFPDEETDILILGYTRPEDAAVLASFRLMATLVSEVHARELNRAAQEAGATVLTHAALDTGMNRIGFPAHTEEEIGETVKALSAWPFSPVPGGGIAVYGMFTHFARADEDDASCVSDDGLTSVQYRRYRAVMEGLRQNGLCPRICHVCNSAAAVRFPPVFPDRCLDEVRFGISLYGYGVPFPDGATDPDSPRLKPVMRLESDIVHIHPLLPGETVGYGGTFSSAEPRLLGTLPIGYADGLLRALSGAFVTVHTAGGDFRAPIVGRICMDQCMIDVTGIPAAVGDTVTVFGEHPSELEELAAKANTITYELLCLLTARVVRQYRA